MIGNNIRTRRLELGMTQEELAHKAGYKSRAAINKIEKGVNDLTQSTLKRIAVALEINPVELMDYHLESERAKATRIARYVELFSDLNAENQDIIIKTMQAMKPTRANVSRFDVEEELKKREDREKR